MVRFGVLWTYYVLQQHRSKLELSLTLSSSKGLVGPKRTPAFLSYPKHFQSIRAIGVFSVDDTLDIPMALAERATRNRGSLQLKIHCQPLLKAFDKACHLDLVDATSKSLLEMALDRRHLEQFTRTWEWRTRRQCEQWGSGESPDLSTDSLIHTSKHGHLERQQLWLFPYRDRVPQRHTPKPVHAAVLQSSQPLDRLAAAPMPFRVIAHPASGAWAWAATRAHPLYSQHLAHKHVQVSEGEFGYTCRRHYERLGRAVSGRNMLVWFHVPAAIKLHFFWNGRPLPWSWGRSHLPSSVVPLLFFCALWVLYLCIYIYICICMCVYIYMCWRHQERPYFCFLRVQEWAIWCGYLRAMSRRGLQKPTYICSVSRVSWFWQFSEAFSQIVVRWLWTTAKISVFVHKNDKMCVWGVFLFARFRFGCFHALHPLSQPGWWKLYVLGMSKSHGVATFLLGGRERFSCQMPPMPCFVVNCSSLPLRGWGEFWGQSGCFDSGSKSKNKTEIGIHTL